MRAMSTPAPPPRPRALGGRGGSSPPRRRPNSSESRRLKLRHSSSRSGGPWLPPPGPCGPREPRPQLGSFKDIYLVSMVSRLGGGASLSVPRFCELGDGVAQQFKSVAGARAHKDARNPTILIALDSGLESGGIDLVPHQKPRRFAGRDLGQHLVDRLRLLVPHRR